MTGIPKGRLRRGCAVRVAGACLAAALMLPGMAACSAGQAGSSVIQPNGPILSIGISSDVPGLGFWHEGAYEGLEVNIARYVAEKLGYARKQIVFKQVMPTDRAARLADGGVDMIVEALPMPSGSGGSDAGETGQTGQTGKSGESGKEIVVSDDAAQYAGPYLSTPQSVLVRPEDKAAMTGTGALRGQTVCTVKGSGASERLLAEEPKADIEERGSYPQCVTDLMTGKAKAVAGDAVILAGLAHAQARDVGVVARSISYGKGSYGIAVPKTSKTLAKNVADALSDMRSDGTLKEYQQQLQAETGWKE